MRIVIKPGGVLLILGILSTMSILALRSNKPQASGLSLAEASVSVSQPRQVVSLIENGDFSKQLTASWNFTKGGPSVLNDDPPAGSQQYVRLNVVPGTQSWHVNMGQPIKSRLKAGDNVVFRGRFRSQESLVLHFYVEEFSGLHAKTVSKQIYLAPEWQEKYIVGTINRDYVPGEAQLMIHFGVVPGTVDMADFHLENHGSAIPPASPTPP